MNLVRYLSIMGLILTALSGGASQAAEPPATSNRIFISKFIDGLGSEVINNTKDDPDFDPIEFEVVLSAVYGIFELYDEAISKLKSIIQIKPDYGFAHFVYASICALKNDSKCAVSELRKSTKPDGRYLYFANKSMDFDKIRGDKDFQKLTLEENNPDKFTIIKGETDIIMPLSALKNNAEKVITNVLLSIVFKKVDVRDTAKKIVSKLDEENKLAAEGNIYDIRLKKVLSTLNPEESYNFQVYLSPVINAFSAADGSVRLTSGIMDLMKDDELASVIAHEIGHVELKHRQKQIYSTQLNDRLGRGLLEAFEKFIIKLNVNHNLNLDNMNSSVEVLVEGKFSQALENDADDFSIEYLRQHGIDANAAIRSLKKFEQYEVIEKTAREARVGKPKDVVSYVSSHLNANARIQRLEENLTKDR